MLFLSDMKIEEAELQYVTKKKDHQFGSLSHENVTGKSPQRKDNTLTSLSFYSSFSSDCLTYSFLSISLDYKFKRRKSSLVLDSVDKKETAADFFDEGEVKREEEEREREEGEEYQLKDKRKT